MGYGIPLSDVSARLPDGAYVEQQKVVVVVVFQCVSVLWIPFSQYQDVPWCPIRCDFWFLFQGFELRSSFVKGSCGLAKYLRVGISCTNARTQ